MRIHLIGGNHHLCKDQMVVYNKPIKTKVHLTLKQEIVITITIIKLVR
jgi:hypothetical protein